LYARDALIGGLSTLWTVDLGDPVVASPVFVDDVVVAATTGGRVVALAAEDQGRELWSYTGTEGSPLGPVDVDLAYADGVVYVADREGRVHLVDVADGTAVCEPFEAFGPVVGNPIVADGITYLPTTTGALHLLPAGRCSGTPPGVVPQIGTSVAFQLPPAVANGVVYALEEQRLLAYDTRDGQLSVWAIPYDAGSRITTAPLVADGLVYIGTQDGRVIAVDATDGTEVWSFRTGEPVAATPAVVPGAVFVVTGDGSVWALAGR
jgi:outer membrane protein assembly factor BamB